MKKFDVARALNILANFGVIVGLTFVGIELQQNTRVIDRDFQISKVDYGLGTFVNSDYLPQIAEKINRVEDTSVSGDLDALLMDAFDLTNAEAARWWRWMLSQWLRDEVDWDFQGEGPLWSFHLHQFDYARETSLHPSARWNLIDHWIDHRIDQRASEFVEQCSRRSFARRETSLHPNGR